MEHMFQSTALSFLFCCFYWRSSRFLAKHVFPFCLQKIACIVRVHGGFDYSDDRFNIAMCEIMFNLEDQYLCINPLLVLYPKKMFAAMRGFGKT